MTQRPEVVTNVTIQTSPTTSAAAPRPATPARSPRYPTKGKGSQRAPADVAAMETAAQPAVEFGEFVMSTP